MGKWGSQRKLRRHILVGGWALPLWKIWKSMGRIIPYIVVKQNMFQTTNQYLIYLMISTVAICSNPFNRLWKKHGLSTWLLISYASCTHHHWDSSSSIYAKHTFYQSSVVDFSNSFMFDVYIYFNWRPKCLNSLIEVGKRHIFLFLKSTPEFQSCQGCTISAVVSLNKHHAKILSWAGVVPFHVGIPNDVFFCNLVGTFNPTRPFINTLVRLRTSSQA